LIDFDDTPVKSKKKSHKSKSKSTVSDESDAYTGSAFGASDGEDTDDATPLTAGELLALADQADAKNGTPKRMNVKSFVPRNIPGSSNTGVRYRDAPPLSPIHNTKQNGFESGNPVCSLCGIRHGDGACYMTESSENLAEYRQMLILHADDEPMEDRVLNYTFSYVS
jgi:chromodomain-helicase-DNA-binding protein 4